MHKISTWNIVFFIAPLLKILLSVSVERVETLNVVHGKGNGLSSCRAIGVPLALTHIRSVASFGSLGALARDSDKPTVHVKFLVTRSGDGTSTT